MEWMDGCTTCIRLQWTRKAFDPMTYRTPFSLSPFFLCFFLVLSTPFQYIANACKIQFLWPHWMSDSLNSYNAFVTITIIIYYFEVNENWILLPLFPSRASIKQQILIKIMLNVKRILYCTSTANKLLLECNLSCSWVMFYSHTANKTTHNFLFIKSRTFYVAGALSLVSWKHGNCLDCSAKMLFCPCSTSSRRLLFHCYCYYSCVVKAEGFCIKSEEKRVRSDSATSNLAIYSGSQQLFTGETR